MSRVQDSGLYICREKQIIVFGRYFEYERFYGTVLKSWGNSRHYLGERIKNWDWSFKRLSDSYQLTIKQDNNLFHEKAEKMGFGCDTIDDLKGIQNAKLLEQLKEEASA